MRAGILIWTTVLLGSGLALTDAMTVIQQDKRFSEAEVTVKVGRVVVVTNKDPITHNVYSSTPGMSFDLRAQKPGETREISFDHAGEADVRCAIHPQMKMKMKVTE